MHQFRSFDGGSVRIKGAKTLYLRAEKHYFLSKYPFAIFTNKIICSTLTLYIANLGIDVTTTKTQVFSSVQNSYRTSQLAVEKHSFPSKCWFKISHEHSKSFHLNFISTANIGINIIKASSKFSSCEFFNFFKAFVTSRCWAHET